MRFLRDRPIPWHSLKSAAQVGTRRQFRRFRRSCSMSVSTAAGPTAVGSSFSLLCRLVRPPISAAIGTASTIRTPVVRSCGTGRPVRPAPDQLLWRCCVGSRANQCSDLGRREFGAMAVARCTPERSFASKPGLHVNCRNSQQAVMHAAIADKWKQISRLCKRHEAARLGIFGSAARGSDFDPESSDVVFW